MRDRRQVDEYLGGSGWQAPSREQTRLLERYEARHGATQCRYGCGDCLNACPAGVPISDVLRTRMYAEDYSDLAFARSQYAALGAGASVPQLCAAACAGACPHGLDIPELTRRPPRDR
jgi:predicted aldo/keto reductase-like oxidoreductase